MAKVRWEKRDNVHQKQKETFATFIKTMFSPLIIKRKKKVESTRAL